MLNYQRVIIPYYDLSTSYLKVYTQVSQGTSFWLIAKCVVLFQSHLGLKMSDLRKNKCYLKKTICLG